jgi:hypothetical protein
MNHKQRVILADAIHAVRPDWQQAGIVAQLHILDANWTGIDAALAAHAMAVASSPDARTPAAFNATRPSTVANPAPDDFKEPRCYICGNPKSVCQQRQDWEITHALADPHIFEIEEDARANAAPRTPEQRDELRRQIRTLIRSVDDELKAPTREPYLPPDLAAESQARLDLDEHRQPDPERSE